VVKITTNLIQIDVTVTDAKGNIVTDLRPEEFEVYENDQKQNITNFSFIDIKAKTSEKQTADKASGKVNPPISSPPVNLRPDQVRRTIALVVDDLSLSFTSTAYVRQALKKFVDEQMQPNDLVAIIRSGSGIGALQQFTSDKRQLYAAIEKVRWNPLGSGEVNAFTSIGSNSATSGMTETSEAAKEQAKEFDEDSTQFREDLFAVGTLGAVNYVVKGMRELPGRKSIILLSDGFSIGPVKGFSSRVLESVKRLADLANRSAMVIYTMDARGLMPTTLTAADDVSGLTNNEIEEQLSKRKDDLVFGQEGLIYLARITGGMSIINSNDIGLGIQKFLNDQRGYYLVGYQPDDETFDPAKRKFNTLTVKVTRPGLKVRTRSGFFGITDDNSKPVLKTAEDQIVNALSSPFATGDIAIKLAPLFSRDDKKGSFINSFIHVKASDLHFSDEPDGWKKTVFDIVAVAFGDVGQVVDQLHQTETMKVRKDVYEHILKEGFVYTVAFPIKKPGAYQMRVALRDAVTARIGSANQFIEVPDLKKNRLVLSGIIFQNVQDAKPETVLTSNKASASDARHDTALRRFPAGTSLSYNLMIYNAMLEKASGRPKLKSRMNLFQNGKMIFAGKEMDYPLEDDADLRSLPLSGAIQLGAGMAPGEYVLQILVTDLAAKGNNRTKAQWQDFEIVK
jgi:VWFA-related protein